MDCTEGGIHSVAMTIINSWTRIRMDPTTPVFQSCMLPTCAPFTDYKFLRSMATATIPKAKLDQLGYP